MKEETIEEAAEKYVTYCVSCIPDDEDLQDADRRGFLFGANWQKNKYTLEEQHVEHIIGDLEKEYIKGFNDGSNWQEKRSYSKEEVINIIQERLLSIRIFSSLAATEIWFNQYKK